MPTLSGYSSAFYGNSAALYNGVLATTIFFALFMYAYALGSYRPWRRSLIGLVTMSAGLLVAAGVGVNSFVVVAIVGPWLCGLVVASRRDLAKQLEDRAREIEEERQLFADQSVRYERARIARELHDIVAHSVSLMVVQANAGEHLARRDPGAAAEAFASISEAARQSEAEIARLVELLDTSAPATPSTGLRIVDDLVGRARASGLRVTCQFSGDSDNLSEPAAESLYRMAQEAVTNAMKHAPGASIDIAVVGHTASVELRVVNQPALSPRSGLEDAGGGHGVAGMRERVAEMGGTFSAGPTSGAGMGSCRLHPPPPAPRGGHRLTTSAPLEVGPEEISVLIADDQRLVRAGFGVILGNEPDIKVVGEAGDGIEAVRLARSLSPTVVLMDIRMPNMDGLAAARVILTETNCRVLMLTTFDSDDYVYAALRAGASGFLLKDAPSEHLVAAVRVVAAGDASSTPLSPAG